MKVIDKLKEALINQRWDIVEEIYEDFGGNLSELNNDSGKKVRMHNIDLSEPLPVEKPKVNSNSSDDFLSPIKNSNSKTYGGKTGRFDDDGNEIIIAQAEQLDISKSKINLYEDDLSIATGDIEFDRKVINKKPVARKQRKDTMEVPAICKSCEKQFMVLPQFAAHYRCDKCMFKR
jgi:hypothetical protein